MGVRALLLCLDIVWSFHMVRPGVGHHSRATPLMSIDPSVLRDVAVYDLAMEEQVRSLKTRVASLEEAKARAEAQLEAKTEDVEKFAKMVEDELNSSRDQAKVLATELAAVKGELAERTTEVSTLNIHLEAHTGATKRLSEENTQLKQALADAAATGSD
mmetsp:Transcript_20850/g.53241  ORF Transcript_20850/g.53241 Transcript_20850/m.53241 type:complete len:159 (-) Transcript_20850:379-855(-)